MVPISLKSRLEQTQAGHARTADSRRPGHLKGDRLHKRRSLPGIDLIGVVLVENLERMADAQMQPRRLRVDNNRRGRRHLRLGEHTHRHSCHRSCGRSEGRRGRESRSKPGAAASAIGYLLFPRALWHCARLSSQLLLNCSKIAQALAQALAHTYLNAEPGGDQSSDRAASRTGD
jgi:hypothetical protein